MGFDRIERISEEIKRECANIIRELKDPRIPEFLSITNIKVTKDLKFAKVYVSVFQQNYNPEDVIKGLNSSASFVRREISRRVSLRYTPEFSFVLDDAIKQGAYINDIIAGLSEKARGDSDENC